jgi:monovalent cation:H+ antiporter-2, CPA2 family
MSPQRVASLTVGRRALDACPPPSGALGRHPPGGGPAVRSEPGSFAGLYEKERAAVSPLSIRAGPSCIGWLESRPCALAYPRVVDTAPLVFDIGLALLLAAGLGWVARRLGLPAVVGYLAAGLAVSPFTPGYVVDRAQIALLAEIGVVLLLFEVGIEVDLGRLHREQRGLLLAAPVQIVLSTLISAGVLVALGFDVYGAALLGIAVAMSSSVVVVNITRSRRRTTDRPTDRALLGWSVLQDVTGVALSVLLLAAFGMHDRPPLLALAGLAAFGLLAVVAARVIPWILAHLRSEHDLFLIVSVAAGLVMAAIGALVFGVPMALAAFVAGLTISDRAETAEARRRLLPFRDVFAVLFFVAVGSLIDPGELAGAGPQLALIVALVGLKVAVTWALARVARIPARSFQLSIGLAQMGEFGYVLAGIGLAAGAIAAETFTAVLAAIVVTIAGSAVLVRVAGHAPDRVTSSSAGM